MRQGERRQRQPLAGALPYLGGESQRAADDESGATALKRALQPGGERRRVQRSTVDGERGDDRRLRPRREQATALFPEHFTLAATAQRHFLDLAHGNGRQRAQDVEVMTRGRL